MTLPTLWHLPLSHYSEKVRWALDHKRIPHRRRTPGPAYLVRNWLATRQTRMPILELGGQAIADSTRTIATLEARFPERPLYPPDADARAQALAIEDDLDETLGVSIRAALFTPVFQRDPAVGLGLAMTGMPGNRRLLRPLQPLFGPYYRWRHGIVPSSLDAHRAVVAAAMDRIERWRGGRPHLVGDAFSVADLTAAALLGVLLRPPELQYPLAVELPSYVLEYRQALLDHAAARWALQVYARDRATSMAIGER